MLKRVGAVVAFGAAFSVHLAGAQLVQQGGKLVGAGATGNAWQGSAISVSADGNTAIIGGYLDDSAKGAAWVFSRSGGAWAQQGDKLVGSGVNANAAGGWSVAISGDGNTAILGGPGDSSGVGGAWVFVRSGGTWSAQGNKLVGGGATGHASQGWSVALSADGSTAVVGGPGDNSGVGAVWVFTRSGTAWKQLGSKLVVTDAVGKPGLGTSVAVSGDGGTIFASGPEDNNGTGAVWVFTQVNSKWAVQGNKLVGTAPNTTFKITADATVTASFTQQPSPCYTLTTAVDPVGEGQVAISTLQNCTGGYLPGTQISLQVTPNSGWALTGWAGTGGSFSTITSIWTTFTITGNATVTASFLLASITCDTLTVLANPAEGGSAVLNSALTCTSPIGFTQGTSITLNATPAAGWMLSTWTATGGVFADPTLTIARFTISGNATVTANFVPTPTTCHTLSVAASPGGSGGVAVNTPQNCSGGYLWGTQLSLAAVPAPGWTPSGWSGSGGVISNPGALSVGVKQGMSLAVSNDGNTAVFGGAVRASAGTVWVFTRSGSTWLQQGNPLVVSGDAPLAQQIWSVALSADGNTAALAQPGDNNGAGAAWVFTRSGGIWTQQGGRLVGTGASGAAAQGSAVALSSDGGTALVGGPNDAGGAGAVWAFATGATPACTYAVAPASQGFGILGGSGTIAVSVTSGSSCPWVAQSNVSWIAVITGGTGTGNGQVAYAVSSNSGASRAGTLDVAGQTFTVYQAGTNCTYALDSASVNVPGSGGSGSFNVISSSDCPWTAATTTPWLHVTGGSSGIGTGPVSFSVDANPDASRSGTIIAAGQTFTVAQVPLPPVASFTVAPSDPVVGEILQFTDTSTGFPVSWSWDFGDGGVSNAQNPTHMYAVPGLYDVVLTVVNTSAQAHVTNQIAVPPGQVAWLPVVSHVDGRNGARWRSDVGILNPGTVPVTAQASFFSAGGVVNAKIVLPAGSQRIFTDAVGRLSSAGSGALEILSSQPLAVTSRTYDALASGTVGQGYGSYDLTSALGTDDSAWLPQLTENAAYRTNISLTNIGTEIAITAVSLFDGQGNPLASYDVVLLPGQWAQENQPFLSRAGQTAMDEGYARVTVTAGFGVIASATVADNATNDPTTIAMVPTASVAGPGSVWIPAVSHVQGSGGSQWRSDLGILNPGTATATVRGNFYSPNGVVSATIAVPAGNQRIVADVVGRLSSSGSGALELVSDQPLVVTSRTYDQQANGTVGQGYDSYTSASALGANQSALLPQLTENAAYRTNISLTNTSAAAAAVTVYLFDGSGIPLGSYDVTLAPGEFAQANQPFLTLAPQIAMDAGFALVTVTSGSGVIASASVVDNVTHDPTTVAMVRQ